MQMSMLLLSLFITLSVVFGRRNVFDPRHEPVNVEEIKIIVSTMDDNDEGCQLDHFQACRKALFNELDMNSDDGSVELRAKIKQLESELGREGFDQICSAMGSFSTCLDNRNQLDNCASPQAISQPGDSRREALAFFDIVRKKNYECRHRDFFVAPGTWECLQSITSQRNRHLEGCHSTLTEAVSSQSRHICSHLSTYRICVSSVFEERCGIAMAKHMCKVVGLGLELRFPQCTTQCDGEGDGQTSDNGDQEENPNEQILVDRQKSDTRQSDVEQCDLNRMRRCSLAAWQNNNDGTEGGTEGGTENGDSLQDALDEVMIRSKNRLGFSSLCRMNVDFRDCMGSENVTNCLKLSRLIDMGIAPLQAASIQLNYFAINFECNNSDFMDNFACIRRVQRDHRDDLMLCSKQFERLSKTQDKMCKSIRYFTRCVQLIVSEECGANAGMAMCQYADSLARQRSESAEECNEKCDDMGIMVNNLYVTEDEQLNNDDQDDETIETDNDDMTMGCDQRVFNTCSSAYKKELGIEKSVHGVYSFIMALKRIVDKGGKRGFERICSAGVHFQQCGGEKVKKCFDIRYLIKQRKMKPRLAIALNVTVFSLSYECSHPVFDQHFDCLVKISHEKREVFRRCERRFRREIKRHGMCPCKAGQNFLNCSSSPFKRSCGKETSDGVCHFHKSLLHAYVRRLKSCSLHCA